MITTILRIDTNDKPSRPAQQNHDNFLKAIRGAEHGYASTVTVLDVPPEHDGAVIELPVTPGELEALREWVTAKYHTYEALGAADPASKRAMPILERLVDALKDD